MVYLIADAWLHNKIKGAFWFSPSIAGSYFAVCMLSALQWSLQCSLEIVLVLYAPIHIAIHIYICICKLHLAVFDKVDLIFLNQSFVDQILIIKENRKRNYR